MLHMWMLPHDSFKVERNHIVAKMSACWILECAEQLMNIVLNWSQHLHKMFQAYRKNVGQRNLDFLVKPASILPVFQAN